MKQYFYSLFAATAMLLATASCSQDELENAAQGNEVDVTFTLKQEGNTATRAIGDGTTAKYLYFGAYHDDKYVETLQPEGYSASTHVQFDENLTATVKLRLVKGQTYKFLFWAQSTTDETYYTVDFENGQVNVIYKEENGMNVINANDEKRDAFWHATENITITGPLTETIVLKRPFAQVNVGIAQGELAEAMAAGVDVATSSFYFNEVATTLSVFDGKVSNPKAMLYKAATIPAEATPTEVLTLDVDDDGVKEEYEYLAMNYILVNDATKADASGKYVMSNATFAIQTATKSIKEYKVPNLRVQRNWRTNIIASIMSDAEFKIVIDPIFTDDYNYPKTGKEMLDFAAVNGGEVTLTEDVTLDGTLTVTSNMVLNLNGKTITNKVDNEATDVIVVEEGATLTINGEEGGVTAVSGNDGYAIISKGKLIINGGTYRSGLDATGDGNCTIYASGNGEIYIYGGDFSTPEGDDTTYVINKKDQDRETTTILIYGGKFKNFDPANNPAEGVGTNFVAEGYYSCLDGDCYVVSNSQMVNTIANLKAAIENGGEITLVGDVEVSDFLVVAKETTLNLNGHTLTQPETATADAVLAVKRGATLTIEGDGEIVSATGAAVKLTMKGETGEETAKLVVNGGKLQGKWWGIAGNGSRDNTEIIVNGGEITATEGLGIFHPQVGKLTINGGEISGNLAGVEMRAGTLNITGGKLTATATEFTIKANGSGSTIQGAAVGVSQHNADKDIAVTISGGEFNGVYAFYEEDVQNQNSSNISVSITGGTFNGKVYTENGNKENVKVTVANSEVLTDAVEKGYEVVLGENIKLAKTVKGSANIDGNGYTMTIAKNESQYLIQPTGGVIKNLTITGYNARNTNGKVLRGIYTTPDTDLLIENCHISGVAYPLNTGSAVTAGQTLTVKNSTLVGWTSFSGGLAVANFSNTHFGIGTFFGKDSDPAWNGCIKPYVNTTLTDCSFENGFYIDFSELAAGEKLTLKNCKVGNTVLTATNIWSLLNYAGTPAEGVLVFE